MFEEYKYRIELHAHTSPASGCSEISPEILVKTYHDIGCHAVTITNHFSYCLCSGDKPNEKVVSDYMDDFYRAKSEGDRLGIIVLFGLELRFSENSNDYLIFGVDEKEALTISYMLGQGIQEFRQNYTNKNSILIQAHPFRNGMQEIDPSLLDGIEAFNMHPHHNSRVAVAANYARKYNLTAIAGTDYHHFNHEGLGITLSRSLPGDSYELAALIKSRDFKMEVGGYILA
ncbi:MAG: PHP domain-containing protein [Eubacteriales bacterium]